MRMLVAVLYVAAGWIVPKTYEWAAAFLALGGMLLIASKLSDQLTEIKQRLKR